MGDLSKATSRPWKRDGKYVWASGKHNANVCAVGEPHEGDFVGYVELKIDSPHVSEAYANAALIVHCVNLHDELVAALREALVWMDSTRIACEQENCSTCLPLGYPKGIATVRTALAKAKEARHG